MVPAFLVPLPVDAHAAIQDKKLFAARMPMAGKQRAGLELEEDGSAAGLGVESKLTPTDPWPLALLPGQQIAVNHDFTGHEFHRLVPPT